MSDLIEQFQTTTDLEFFKNNYPEDYNERLVDTICKNKGLKKILKNNVNFHCGSKTKVHNAFVEYLNSLKQPQKKKKSRNTSNNKGFTVL